MIRAKINDQAVLYFWDDPNMQISAYQDCVQKCISLDNWSFTAIKNEILNFHNKFQNVIYNYLLCHIWGPVYETDKVLTLFFVSMHMTV